MPLPPGLCSSNCQAQWPPCHRFPSLAVGSVARSWSCGSHSDPLSCFSLLRLPWPQAYALVSVLATTQANPHPSLERFSALSFLVLCPADSRCYCLLEPQLFPHLRTPPGLPRFPLPALWPHNPPRAVGWATRMHHMRFLPRSHCPVLPVVPRLNTLVSCLLAGSSLFEAGEFLLFWFLLFCHGWKWMCQTFAWSSVLTGQTPLGCLEEARAELFTCP